MAPEDLVDLFVLAKDLHFRRFVTFVVTIRIVQLTARFVLIVVLLGAEPRLHEVGVQAADVVIRGRISFSIKRRTSHHNKSLVTAAIKLVMLAVVIKSELLLQVESWCLKSAESPSVLTILLHFECFFIIGLVKAE